MNRTMQKNQRRYICDVLANPPKRPNSDSLVLARPAGGSTQSWALAEAPEEGEEVEFCGVAVVDDAVCGVWRHENGYELAQPLASS